MTKDEASKQAWLNYHYHDDRIEAGLSPSQFGWSKYQLGFDAGYDFANRWNVIERDGLPDQDGEYRVTCAGEMPGSGKPFRFVMDADFKDGDWEFIANVVAWRPMPEPYRGDVDNADTDNY